MNMGRKTLKLCLVSQDFVPIRNSGVAVYAETLVRGLSIDCNVTVVTAHQAGLKREEYLDGVRVIRIPLSKVDRTRWISFGYRASKLVEHLDKAERYDVIHFLDAHIAYPFARPFIATVHQSFNQRLRADGGIPYHSSFINLAIRYIYYNIGKSLEKRVLTNATKLIAVSKATKEEIVAHYGIDQSKIEVIYEGIDIQFFVNKNDCGLRHKLGIKEHEKILLFVGFTTPRKGIEYLAEALSRLKYDFRLLMIGKWEKGYRQKFLSHVAKPYRDKIIELGYVSNQEMPYYYSLADVLVLPSLLEGFGFPLVEALACETPVVATTVGSIPEVVGDCGILVPPRDADALAEAVNTLFQNHTLERDIGQRGAQRVREYFDRNKMIQQTIALYETVCTNLRRL